VTQTKIFDSKHKFGMKIIQNYFQGTVVADIGWDESHIPFFL
jgi:hypothetical protein